MFLSGWNGRKDATYQNAEKHEPPAFHLSTPGFPPRVKHPYSRLYSPGPRYNSAPCCKPPPTCSTIPSPPDCSCNQTRSKPSNKYSPAKAGNAWKSRRPTRKKDSSRKGPGKPFYCIYRSPQCKTHPLWQIIVSQTACPSAAHPENPHIRQQKNTILKDVSLEIKEGEFVYLIGKVGSGKTSLLKTLYAELPLIYGKGEVAGYQLSKIKKSQIAYLRRKCGIVFQDFKLLTDRNVYANLEFVLKATGWKDIFQLDDILGVERENGLTLNTRRYNTEEHRNHFILEDTNGGNVDFGEGKKNIVALEGTTVLVQNATELPFAVRHAEEVQMAVKQFGKGRGVYISGLPYSFENSRVLYRAVLWSANSENELHKWYSTNYNVEVHAYVKNGKYCVVNNTYEPQDTTVYIGDGSSFDLHLNSNEIKWYEI